MVLIALALAGTSFANVISTFDTDSEGWTVAGNDPDNMVQYFSTGGLPGGFIQRTDTSVSYFHFQAPAKFLGNLTGYSYISYDLLQTVTSNDTSWFYRVVLEGAGLMLLNSVELPVNPTSWVHQQVYFQPLGWQLITNLGHVSGAPVTAEQFASVLSNVTALYITGDLANMPVDIASLDNVMMINTPEPSTVVLISAGLAGLWLRRRRRR